MEGGAQEHTRVVVFRVDKRISEDAADNCRHLVSVSERQWQNCGRILCEEVGFLQGKLKYYMQKLSP